MSAEGAKGRREGLDKLPQLDLNLQSLPARHNTLNRVCQGTSRTASHGGVAPRQQNRRVLRGTLYVSAETRWPTPSVTTRCLAPRASSCSKPRREGALSIRRRWSFPMVRHIHCKRGVRVLAGSRIARGELFSCFPPVVQRIRADPSLPPCNLTLVEGDLEAHLRSYEPRIERSMRSSFNFTIVVCNFIIHSLHFPKQSAIRSVNFLKSRFLFIFNKISRFLFRTSSVVDNILCPSEYGHSGAPRMTKQA